MRRVHGVIENAKEEGWKSEYILFGPLRFDVICKVDGVLFCALIFVDCGVFCVLFESEMTIFTKAVCLYLD